ncbi:MAG: NAD(P)-binding domain-containing protein, partial [Burkholderiales bacterium]|nr:NAD(P)-binding domain-containing protein [Burkholderiales bacterium]
MKITIVGAGNMSSALVKQLSKAGHEIRITSREISKAQALASNNSRVTAVPAAQAVGASDIVIIATAYADAVPALRS